MTPRQIKTAARECARVNSCAEAEVERFLLENEARREGILARAAGRMVELDCVTAGDFDVCSGCAYHGPKACTKQHLTDLDHATCEAEARRLAEARGKRPCHDCAFRKGSPEIRAEMTEALARQSPPFRCHQAAPLDGKGREPSILAFWPRDESLYPVCAGWAAARAALKLRQALARSVAQMCWRLSARRSKRRAPTQRELIVRELGGRRFKPPRCAASRAARTAAGACSAG